MISDFKFQIFIMVVMGLVGLTTQAQNNPEFLFNWKSDTFVPAYYLGKSLPINNATIHASFEIINNNKLANLSDQNISWTVNNKLIASGKGKQSVTFATDTASSNDLVVRINLKDYNGGAGSVFIIPLTTSEVVVEQKGNVFYAWPFFFNVKKLADIKFSWEANGQQTTGDVATPNRLELETPTGGETTVNISAFAQNKFNPLEVAQKVINLFY